MTADMIRMERVTKRLRGKLVLDEMSLSVKPSETYVILGPSGVGKSVTLKLIIGLMKPDSGRILIDGTDIVALPRREMLEFRRTYGFLFQSGALINWLSVFENIALPLREKRTYKDGKIREEVARCLEMVDLSGAEKLMPDQLSGGMKKRVALARAIVTNPRIILYDEPTTGLDPIVAETINHLVLRLQQRLHTTSVVVTHDLHSAFMVGNIIGLLENGKIIAEGAPAQLMRSTEPTVRRFIDVTRLSGSPDNAGQR
jgi:phospholipid/cholesterol/gamma-HCH transport system ATP-binding protein